jgi:hypothetical protein
LCTSQSSLSTLCPENVSEDEELEVDDVEVEPMLCCMAPIFVMLQAQIVPFANHETISLCLPSESRTAASSFLLLAHLTAALNS